MVLLEQFMQPEVRPFAVAALMIALVGGLEVAGMIVGMSFSELFGHAFDFGHGSNDSGIVQVMSRINVGSVPLMICILLALGIFSIYGFLIQDDARKVAMPMPATAAGVLAAVVSLPLRRNATRDAVRLIPQDESYALWLSYLVCRVC